MERESVLEVVAAEHAAFLAELEVIRAAVTVCDDKGFMLQTIRRVMRKYEVEAE